MKPQSDSVVTELIVFFSKKKECLKQNKKVRIGFVFPNMRGFEFWIFKILLGK